MQNYYLKKNSNLVFLKKSLLFKRVFNIFFNQSRFGFFVLSNNLKQYEVLELQKLFGVLGIKHSLFCSNLVKSSLENSVAQKLPYIVVGSSLYYTNSFKNFFSQDPKSLKKLFNYRFSIISVKFYNKIFSFQFFLNNIYPTMKCVKGNMFYPLLLPVSSWLKISLQVQHVLKAQGFLKG